MAAPLLARDEVIGVMAVWRSAPSRPFTDADLVFLRRPLAAGRDRASRTPAFFADAPRPRRIGRGRQPGQEHLPRRDEPRDPDPDERDHRDERPDPRHAARRRAARLRRDDPTSGDALLTIINDILDFSKIEAGKVELERRRSTSRLHRGRARRRRAAGRVEAPRAAPTRSTRPARTIVGDDGRLRQIVINLLSNAIKFTDVGEVELRSASDVDARADAALVVRIEVRDTGIGIPADRIDRLFQSFSQVDASISRRMAARGSGWRSAAAWPS